jgi:hypothetical protein
MGAREEFELAVRRGDFLGAAEAWVIDPPESGASLKGFESKLDSSLEGRTVAIGETLLVQMGEYQFLGDKGKNGARLAFIADNASLDDIEYIHGAADLAVHFEGQLMPVADREAVVAFYARSERAALEKARTVETMPQDTRVTEPAPAASLPALDPLESLRKLLSERNGDTKVVDIALQVAAENMVNERVHVGALASFGAAPYQNDPENSASFYVALREPNGRVDTVWGKELQEALRTSGVEIGANFLLAHQGTKAVTVKVPERDPGTGEKTGNMVDAPATRNHWKAISLEELYAIAMDQIEEQENRLQSETALGAQDAIADAQGVPQEGLAAAGTEVDALPAQAAEQIEVAGDDEAEQDAILAAPLQPNAADVIARASATVVDAISNARAPSSEKHLAAASGAQPAVAGPKTLLNGRFVLRDRGEYFRVADGVESPRVALVDEQSKIRFVDKQMDTFQAAIELAKHKQWEAILVTGSEKFRAEAWHHARMAGLEVIGYEPSEQDMATLKQAQENGTKAQVQVGVTRVDAAVTAKDEQLEDVTRTLLADGYGVKPATVETGRHVGKVLHETEKHFVQDVGRKVATVHDRANFDQATLKAALEKGGTLKIQYDNGKGSIDTGKDRAKDRGR